MVRPLCGTPVVEMESANSEISGPLAMAYLEHVNPEFFINSPIRAIDSGYESCPWSVDPGLWVDISESAGNLGNGIGFYGHPPKFIDPRTVADYPFTTTHEPSCSSSISMSGDSQSRSTSPDSNEVPNKEDRLSTDPCTPTHQQFNCSYTVAPLYRGDSQPQSYQSPLKSSGIDFCLPSSQMPSSGRQSSPVVKELTPPPSPPARRRGPGRPSKAQSAAQFPNNKRPTGHSAVKIRRQMHNDSAMRSRARLNNMLEELWNIIPKSERALQADETGTEISDNREVCRALKVEVAINYMKKLQARLEGDRNE